MSGFLLQLGDIIRIISPKDPEYHGKTFFVYYYDPNGFLELVHTTSMQIKTIPLKQGASDLMGQWESIELCSRAMHRGFARQNGLLPGAWVELEFHGDVREIITAKIQHLEEDMTTLLTHPQGNLYYLDFAYKGIPKNIPLRGICLCNPPKSYQGTDPTDDKFAKEDEKAQQEQLEQQEQQEQDEGSPDGITVEDSVVETTTPSGEIEIIVPDDVSMEEDYMQELENEASHALKDHIVDITDSIGVRKTPGLLRVQYNADVQMNDLLESLVYSIPEEERTRLVMKNIYNHLERFRELRDLYSVKDQYGKIQGPLVHENPKLHKPLLETYIPTVNRGIHSGFLLGSSYVEKKLYPNTDDRAEDIQNDEFLRMLAHENEIVNEFYHKDPTGVIDGYIPYQQMLSKLGKTYWKPYTTPNADLSQYPTVNTQHDIDIVAGNKSEIQRVHGPSFFSSRKSPLIQSMSSESIPINGTYLLPEKYLYDVNNAHIQSSILQKCHYRTPYLYFLLTPKNTITIPLNGESIEKRLTAEKNENIIYPHEKKVVYVKLQNDALYENQLPDLLRCVIPNSFALIEKYKDKNREKYSLQSYLAGFRVYEYTNGNVPFTAMKMVQYHLRDNIRRYYEDAKVQKMALNEYLIQTNSTYTDQFVDTYFDRVERPKYRHMMGQAYRLKIQTDRDKGIQVGNQRNILTRLYAYDDMQVFAHLLLLQNVELITPSIQSTFVEPRHFYDNNQKAVAKQYDSIQSMQKDNDVRDLKYDEKYDGNQYSIMDQYKNVKGTMSPEQFQDFVANDLAERHGCSIQNTATLAEELIQGYKVVKDGDYALLEMKPTLPQGVDECKFTETEKQEIQIEAQIRKIQKYFRRDHNTWVYDPDVDSSSFAKPNDLTCNDLKTTPSTVNQDILKKYGQSTEEIQKNVVKAIENKKKQLDKMVEKRTSQQDLFDVEHYLMAMEVDDTDRIVSPYQEQLDLIRNPQNDFTLTQENIRKFRHTYCRDPMVEENQHWFYCKETSIPLLPRFEFELANAFYRGHYEETLYSMKKQAKRMDGYYYEIHTGRVLCMMDFADETMAFDNNDFMEDDDNVNSYDKDAFVDEIEVNHSIYQTIHESKLYADPQMRKCLHILKAVCKNLYIPVEKIEHVAMDLCGKFLLNEKVFIPREKYEQALAAKEAAEKKKDKDKTRKALKYDEFYYSLLLYTVVCSTLISVQTLTPSLNIRRTFGQCTKEFGGFPLEKDSAQDGSVVYISCVLRTMRTDAYPWKVISKTKGKLERKLMGHLTDVMLQNADVQELLTEKRAYLEHEKSTQDDAVITAAESLRVRHSWPRFLPPAEISILKHTDTIKPITSTIHEAFEKALRTGDPAQWNYYGMYLGKSFLFSLGIAEMIHKTVQEKGQILGVNSPFPVLENTCCNELNQSHNPVEYFKNENDSIKLYINNVAKINGYLDKTWKGLSYSQMMVSYHQRASPNQQETPNIFCLYNDVLMYKTYIRYLNLDSTIKPIPEFLKVFLAEKPPEYDKNSSIEEKIHLLKQNQHALNLKQFTSIMTSVYKKNIVKVIQPIEVQHKQAVLNSWEDWKRCITETIPNESTMTEEQKKLYHPVQKIKMLLETYFERNASGLSTTTAGQTEDSKEGATDDEKAQGQEEMLVDLHNGLIIETRNMKEALYAKIGEYVDLKRFSQYFKPLNQPVGLGGIPDNTPLTCFEKWTNDPNVSYLDLARILKNYLYYLTVVIPSGILHAKTESHFNANSWFFNKSDKEKMKDVVDERYNGLNTYTNDAIMKQIIQSLQSCWKTIYSTVALIHGCFPEEHDTLYKDYLLFCLYYVFYRLVYVEDEIAELIIQENDNQDSMDMIEFVNKDTIVYKSCCFLRYLLNLDSANRNTFVRNIQKSVIQYSSIQNNIDKIRSKEKEQIQLNFRENNKKILAAEKALKKVKMGNYYTDINLLKKYGKRDKFTKDTAYLNTTAEQNENESSYNEMDAMWNHIQTEGQGETSTHAYEDYRMDDGLDDYDDDADNMDYDEDENMDYDELYEAGDNDGWDMLEKEND